MIERDQLPHLPESPNYVFGSLIAGGLCLLVAGILLFGVLPNLQH